MDTGDVFPHTHTILETVRMKHVNDVSTQVYAENGVGQMQTHDNPGKVRALNMWYFRAHPSNDID